MLLTPMIAFSLATLQAPAIPSTATPLRGSGPWTVEFADKLCAMGRQFAAPSGIVTLVIKAPLVGEEYTFTVASPPDPAKKAALGSAYVVKPDGARAGPFPLSTFTATTKQRVARFSIDGEDFKLGSVGSVLTIDLATEGVISFSVPGMSKALAALELCTRGLRGDFGIDQRILDRVVVKEKSVTPGASIFSPNDYPRDALMSNERGAVGVLAFIEPTGRVSNCRVIESSKSRSLDTTTCNIVIKRSRFDPARDAQGNTLRVPIYTRVRWEIHR